MLMTSFLLIVKLKSAIILTMIACILLLTSCGDTPTEGPTQQTGTIYSLTNGNKWIFEMEDYAEDKNPTYWIDTIQTTVISDTLISGENWKKIDHQYQYLPELSYSEYLYNKADGVWIAGKDSNGIFQSRLYLKYPCSVNEKYTTYIPEFKEEFKITVKQTSIVVSPPGGTFFCMKYEAVSKNYKVEIFASKDFGIALKRVYTLKPNTTNFVLAKEFRLLKYTLK